MKPTDLFQFSKRVDLPNKQSESGFAIQWGELTNEDRAIIEAYDRLTERLSARGHKGGAPRKLTFEQF